MAETFFPAVIADQLIKTSKEISNENGGDLSAEKRLIALVNEIPPDELNLIRQKLAANDDEHLLNFMPSLNLIFDANNKLSGVTIKGANNTRDPNRSEIMGVHQDGTFYGLRFGQDTYQFSTVPAPFIPVKQLDSITGE